MTEFRSIFRASEGFTNLNPQYIQTINKKIRNKEKNLKKCLTMIKKVCMQYLPYFKQALMSKTFIKVKI